MKEQLKTAILPALPIVGKLKLSTWDGKSLYSIEVVTGAHDKILSPFFQQCFESLSGFLTGENKVINIKLDYSSITPFQMKVLNVMKTIPYGKVATYREIAEKLNSRAYQAIGSACGRNPFLLIYPCHRVIGTNNPGGFAHGLSMKKDLLALEGFKFLNSSAR
jgi:O-6-methylguanine DNA methyltransferase